jgi:enoyl-CoA hydratase/carnithine racemase
MAALVHAEVEEGVARLRLDRPDKRNAFNRDLSEAFVNAFDQLEADEGVRAIIITGSGEAFCAGADMTEAVAALDNGAGGNGMAMAALRVARCAKPVIGAINGFAFGGGAVLACACDIRIASERASFRFPGAEYGLVVGATVLPRIVGPAVAKELIFTARPVEASEAGRIGLVNRVVPHDALDAETTTLALQIAINSPEALRWSKAVIDAATTVERGNELEIEANRALRGSPEHVSRFRDATERVAPAQPRKETTS